jgi:pimeloyl-[acyl-carrier protein] methyl ester esterase
VSNIICISGWGQKFNSLETIFSDSIFDPFFIGEKPVSSLDYSLFGDVENFFDDVRACIQTTQCNKSRAKSLNTDLNPSILLGWSLGGQLAIRLIEKKILSPKLLILISPPFQMVKDARIQAAMPLSVFEEFYNNFAKAPDKTLKKFAILTAINDRNANEIARNLYIDDKNFPSLAYWLSELGKFSCFDVDFSNMPQTIYFQGAGDMIVPPSQAKYFQERIKNFRLEIFKNCGHAPHLSNLEKVRMVIAEKINGVSKN